jgi:hypothetical protein
MSSTSLRLYPATPAAAPGDLAHFFVALQAVGLIDPAVGYSVEGPYSHGPRFYELITFHISHMVIQLALADNQVEELGLIDSRGLCRIAFSEVSAEQAFLGMSDTRPPRYPVCAYMVPEW